MNTLTGRPLTGTLLSRIIDWLGGQEEYAQLAPFLPPDRPPTSDEIEHAQTLARGASKPASETTHRHHGHNRGRTARRPQGVHRSKF